MCVLNTKLFMMFTRNVNLFIFRFKFQESCQNYIRVLVSLGPGRLLVCGTNSFRPFCREYGVQRDSYHMEREKSGQAVCPYDPEHNSTAVYAGEFTTLFIEIIKLNRLLNLLSAFIVYLKQAYNCVEVYLRAVL